ncbi:glycosyltransferase [Labedella gwakjiensis]
MNDLPKERSQPRVLHLGHTTEIGGAEMALARLLESSTRGWNAHLLIPRKPRSNGAFSELASPIISRVGPAQAPGATSSGRSIGALLRFALSGVTQAVLIRTNSSFRTADVLHANTSRSAIYAALAALSCRTPLVIHLRDMVSRESLGALGYELFTRLVLRRADGVIANSGATLDSALPHLRASTHSEVIPSPAGITTVAHSIEAARRAARPVDVIGMVARVDEWKGHEVLLRAFSAAFAGSHVRLKLAGGTPFANADYQRKLLTLCEDLGVTDQVEWLGHVTDVPTFIASLDVCVQSSIRPEPLGQNVLQYLAAGKPTVAVDAGGPAEWIENETTGILTDMGDVDALADALTRLADDQELRVALATNAPTTVADATDEIVTQRHAAFFRQVVGRRPGQVGP